MVWLTKKFDCCCYWLWKRNLCHYYVHSTKYQWRQKFKLLEWLLLPKQNWLSLVLIDVILESDTNSFDQNKNMKKIDHLVLFIIRLHLSFSFFFPVKQQSLRPFHKYQQAKRKDNSPIQACIVPHVALVINCFMRCIPCLLFQLIIQY